jgi:hypothetical protein
VLLAYLLLAFSSPRRFSPRATSGTGRTHPAKPETGCYPQFATFYSNAQTLIGFLLLLIIAGIALTQLHFSF